jgi:predicted nucleotide-binding protein
MSFAHNAASLRTAIIRLRRRVEEVEAINPAAVEDQFHNPQLDSVRASIADALARTFGNNSPEYRRYAPAAHFSTGSVRIGARTPIAEVRQAVAESKAKSIALLNTAIRSLEEQLQEQLAENPQPPLAEPILTRKVFVVHGHDDGAREAVARFLERIGFEAIVLHEQANRGRTVIEKIEAHGDVDFAVVLLTPDDEGRARNGNLEPRARQNVLLELGYFIGRLGRERVCALKRGEVEIPSDFAGVVWQAMDDGGGWRQTLSRELEAAGHEVDWNTVMRS